MASHEELIAELVKLEKLSHAARLKHAKKRRLKQLKKYQEWVRYDRQTNATVSRKRIPAVLDFENAAVLNDLVSRDDRIGVSKVLEKGADPNISNADGLTPLHKCCIDNAQEMAEVILEHSVDINARDIEGWTPLHAAAATGNIQMINLLIDNGASLVAINNDDKMPIDVAADSDIKYVLQQKMIEAGYTDDVLEYIRVSVPKTMLADLKDSVKNDRSLNIQDKFGASALHVAAANGYTEVVDFLLEQEELDLDIADNEGWTPFHAAVCWNQPDMMKKLAEKGCDMDLKNLRGETPYMIAEDPELRQLILELKGQYGQSQDMTEEEEEVEMSSVPRARRMSIKRMTQQAKNELAKQSVQEEVSMRRESMAHHDMQMSLTGKVDEKVISDEIATQDDDEEAITLLKIISMSNETAKQNSIPEATENGGESIPLVEQSKESSSLESQSQEAPPKQTTENNRYTRKTDANRPNRISLQEPAFNKDRTPRKSVLKHHNRPIARTQSTYDSTTPLSPTSPPSSPSVQSSAGSEAGSSVKSPTPNNQKCCVVM